MMPFFISVTLPREYKKFAPPPSYTSISADFIFLREFAKTVFPNGLSRRNSPLNPNSSEKSVNLHTHTHTHITIKYRNKRHFYLFATHMYRRILHFLSLNISLIDLLTPVFYKCFNNTCVQQKVEYLNNVFNIRICRLIESR